MAECQRKATQMTTIEEEFETLFEQEELLPAEPPTYTLTDILIDMIDFEDVGPPPTEQLLTSIKHRGVQTPITVRRADDGRFRLIAGRRRIKSTAAAGRSSRSRRPARQQMEGRRTTGRQRGLHHRPTGRRVRRAPLYP